MILWLGRDAAQSQEVCLAHGCGTPRAWRGDSLSGNGIVAVQGLRMGGSWCDGAMEPGKEGALFMRMAPGLSQDSLLCCGTSSPLNRPELLTIPPALPILPSTCRPKQWAGCVRHDWM